mmetsp:Transcript_15825/g.28509  ORF Transcript_15825/g.28509 Transcript_15825/m.28509 type:complete len:391 (-) Transcript_15825:192-1364(-)
MSEASNQHLKVNNNTLTKQQQEALLRSVLPQCQPQEGSPANTFTKSELHDLEIAVGSVQVGPRSNNHNDRKNNKINIWDLQTSFQQPSAAVCSQDGDVEEPKEDSACPQDAYGAPSEEMPTMDWHGAPRLHKNVHLPRAFRNQVRQGTFTSPTNGVCPGFLQCNLVVLPQGPVAFDFLLFCQRNPKACPLIEVCDVGSPVPHGVAPGADLRTDVPKYAIYRNGELEAEVTDVTEYWPQDSVAFLIGCSFSYDGELMNAGIPLKSAEQGKNVPMYKTNLKCRPAGSLQGNMVVSMKPIPALQISKHVEITSKYTHAHGGPVAVGSAAAIGIQNIEEPEWGEAIDIAYDEVPVFHACGVTPQSILMESKVPFAITHSAGHMFVTDLPADMGV